MVKISELMPLVLSSSKLDDAVAPSYDDVPHVARIFLSRTTAFLVCYEEDICDDPYY